MTQEGLIIEPLPWPPPRNEELRRILGRERRKLAEALEADLYMKRGVNDGAEPLHSVFAEVRRGLTTIERALEGTAWLHYHPDVEAALAELAFWAGARRAANRPKDTDRVRLGARLAGIFEEHGGPVTYGRDGIFSKTFMLALAYMGLKVPEDPLHLLRRVRAALRDPSRLHR